MSSEVGRVYPCLRRLGGCTHVFGGWEGAPMSSEVGRVHPYLQRLGGCAHALSPRINTERVHRGA